MEPVPVISTVYVPEAVPAGTVTVRVDVAVRPRKTEVGLSVAMGPAGVTVAVRMIVPVNPAMLATVIIEVSEEPAGMLRVLGLAVTEKSGGVTTTLTVTE